MRAWFDQRRSDYRIQARYTLRQILFDPGRHPQTLNASIDAALQALRAGDEARGDRAALPLWLDDAAAAEVRRVFGDQFAAALSTLAVGTWQGPVRSGYGVHLVMLQARQDERPARLDEVQQQVAQDLLARQSETARLAWLEQLRARYDVRVEPAPVTVADSSARP